ncbi:MAG: hypothetical protein K0R44_1754 [Thermomicrobiales bacterium]|jgi:hypothetical protein|nr:hypothetical protein [Thermomicrobiales bacterium]
MLIAAARGSLIRRKALGPTPAFGAAGAISKGNVEDLAPGFPSGITAGQLLLLHVERGTTASIGSAPATPSGWTLQYDDARNNGGGNAVRQWIFWKFATGTESGTLPIDFSDSGNKISCIYRITNPHPTSPFEGETLVQGTDDPVNGPSLTPSGANRLGIAFVAVGDNQMLQTVIAGSSGGTWIAHLADADGAGADTALFLNSVSLSAGSQISGGGFSPGMVSDADWVLRGVMIRPSGA